MAALLQIRQLTNRSAPNLLGFKKQHVAIDNPLCTFCSVRGIWQHLSTAKILGPAEWVHGFITAPEDVLDGERRACPFCQMVFAVLPETAFAEAHRHMYRSQGAASVYCSLRPLAIRVRNEVFTSFAVAYNFREYVSHSSKVFQNYRAWIALDSPRRRRYNTPGIAPVRIPEELDPDLISRWLRRCERHHKLCKRSHDHYSPTILVDVWKLCLVYPAHYMHGTMYEYAAMSYVWGQTQALQTTNANRVALMTAGALGTDEFWDQLPQVIRDCIRLTRAIGISYLWVDTLCITQDDYMVKEDEIAHMDTIYSFAKLTIIPFTGNDANVSIPGVRAGTRAATSQSIPSSENEQMHNIVLTSSPEWSSLEYDSAYESRAWTLQEKILSTRCLFLSKWGMWFQCLESRFSDAEAGELSLELGDSAELSLLRIEFPPEPDHPNFPGWRGFLFEQFLSFILHVEWYSARRLTFHSDRIDAFRGILNIYRRRFEQEFLWAHPDNHWFPVSLLWIHVDVGRSRNAAGGVDDEVRVFQDYLPDRDKEYPTWSWLGWPNKVSYRLILDMKTAGISEHFDRGVVVNSPPSMDEEDARDMGIDQALSPELFYRLLNRGVLKVSGPAISVNDMCCGRPSSLHVASLDGKTGVFALANGLYPFYREHSMTMATEQTLESPCGMLFGIPFWQHVHYENHRLILMKTTPGSVGALFERHASFRSMFESSGSNQVCIALLIWISGRYAERKALAILDKAFWDGRDPVVEEYLLL